MVRGAIIGLILFSIFLGGCALDAIEPMGTPKISVSQIFPLPTGTTVSVSQEYEIKEEEMEKIVSAITLPFSENIAEEQKQFVMEIIMPAYRENQALKNGKVCVRFDPNRIAYIAIAAEGLRYDSQSKCYEYEGIQVYQPQGWHLKLVGLAKSIGGDEFIGTPIKITVTGDNYEASVDYSLKIVQQRESFIPI